MHKFLFRGNLCRTTRLPPSPQNPARKELKKIFLPQNLKKIETNGFQ